MQPLKLDSAVKRFGAHSLWIGILLLIVGTIGVILPVVLSELTVALLASLLVAGGLLWVWHSIKHGAGWADWIKPVALVVAGGLIAYRPWAGVASVALLIVAYLVLDAIASFSFAGNASGKAGRGWMIFKGIADIVLAALFLWGWPQSSLWMVGLFVGISLIFDGWALVAIGWSLRNKSSTRDSF